MDDDILRVDQRHLVQHWKMQPSLARQYSTELAEASHELSDAERELKLVFARTARKARETPALYGMNRATDDAVTAAVTVQPEYQEAVKRVNECKRRHDLVRAIVSAIVDRKHTLQALTDLAKLQGYGSEFELPEGEDLSGQLGGRRNFGVRPDDGE